MRAYGVVAILFSVLLCAPAVFAAVSHESAQIIGGVFGSDFGPQNFTVNGTLDLDTLRFIGESTSVTSISALSTLGGGSASNATLPTQWAVKAYVDSQISGSGSMSNFTIAGDTGSSVVIDGQTVTVAGGTSITTSESGRTVTVSITNDSIDGAQLADTITLDATLAFTQGSFDVNFDANTLFIDGSANRVGVVTNAPGASLDVNGDLLLQSGVAVNEFSIDDTLSGNSDLAVPTEQAVKAYVDTAVSGLGSGSMSNFSLAGDSGTSLIVQGDTLNVSGGTGITTSVAADTVTVSITDDSIGPTQLTDTAVSAGSYGDSITVPTFTVDQQGRLTAAGETTIRSASGSQSGVVTTAAQTIAGSKTFTSATTLQDSGFPVATIERTAATQNIALEFANSVNSSYFGYDVTGEFFGAVPTVVGFSSSNFKLYLDGSLEGTSLSLASGATITGFDTSTSLGTSDSIVPTQNAVKAYVDAQIGSSGSMSNFTLTADSGTPQLISQGNTLDIAGGTGITTTVGATDTVTVSITDDSIDGAQLADTITLDATLAITQGTFDVNFDANTLFIDGSANRVGIGTATPASALQVVGDEVRIGTGTPGTATGAGDLFVTDALEVDGSIVLGANTITGFSTATALGTSDALLPTQNAVKVYVDTAITGFGTMTNFTLAGDTGTSLIVQGDTLDVAGGTAITTSVSGDTVTVGVTPDSIDGAQLADTITLDATLAFTQGSFDVNFDANTLVVDGSANRVGIGTAAPASALQVTSGEVRVGTGTPGFATAAGDLYVTDDIEIDDDLYIAGTINQSATGIVQGFSNGCTMIANASGLYWNC